jgi:citronellol/citronellal dehydrogenase
MLDPARNLGGKTLLITGASRGIGKAIALRAARDGANVVVIGKTEQPDPRLPGTVHSATAEIIAAGGQALACAADVRDEEQLARAVEAGASHFGGIDILINNASAITLARTHELSMKRYDLMHQVNARGSFLCAKLCYPWLKRAANPHVLTLSPPLQLRPEWFGAHLGYTSSKFGMSLCTLGLANEWQEEGIAANSLWPKTAIATAAIANLLGGQDALKHCRTPQIVADAAHAILTRPSRSCTGQFFIDEDVLRAEGVEDFDTYAVDAGATLTPDFFVD